MGGAVLIQKRAHPVEHDQLVGRGIDNAGQPVFVEQRPSPIALLLAGRHGCYQIEAGQIMPLCPVERARCQRSVARFDSIGQRLDGQPGGGAVIGQGVEHPGFAMRSCARLERFEDAAVQPLAFSQTDPGIDRIAGQPVLEPQSLGGVPGEQEVRRLQCFECGGFCR